MKLLYNLNNVMDIELIINNEDYLEWPTFNKMNMNYNFINI